MDLNSILSQLGSRNSKDIVYLSVTPGVGLELIQLEVSSHSVKNYAYRPLQYNESLRQIADMEAFRAAVTELFEETKINIKSNVVLNLPMVLFGSKELPLLLGDEAVTEALTSEVEQSYLFQRYEPLVSWVDSGIQSSGDMRKLFYTAVQKNVVEEIQTILTELGARLVSVEMSLTSLLKALSYSGLVEEQMKDNITWNLMLISPNGYSIVSMAGKNIVDYYEEPLAIKSYEGDEIYNAINASAQITLMSYPANYLYIVSETDMVSAELLASRIQADAGVNYFENNSFRKQDIIPVSLEILEEVASKISLEAIGIASQAPLQEKFNFLGESEAIDDPNELVHVILGSLEFAVSPNTARNIVAIVAGIILIPFLVIMLMLPMIAKQKQAKLDDVNSRLENLNKEIGQKEGDLNEAGNFNANKEIKKVLADNRAKLIGYTALGESVTKNLWITYFSVKDDGKFDIKGASENVEDIYTFFRNMKDSLLNTKLRIHKLEMKTNSVDEAVSIDINQPAEYEFEITNMSDAELAPLPAEEPKPAAKDAKDAKPQPVPLEPLKQ